MVRGEIVAEQIVVGTPGTLLDWCLKYKAIDLRQIRVFVLDEADVMISQQGHQDQSIRLRRYCRFLYYLMVLISVYIHNN